MATKKSEVKTGQVWWVRLSTGRMARVRIMDEYEARNGHTNWHVEDIDTHREFTIHSAQKLRRLVIDPKAPLKSLSPKKLVDNLYSLHCHHEASAIEDGYDTLPGAAEDKRISLKQAHVTPPMMSVFEKQVREFLTDNPGFTSHATYEDLTPQERFDYWLRWNGIINHTASILEAFAVFFLEPRFELLEKSEDPEGLGLESLSELTMLYSELIGNRR